jgi:Big-like domain-containing protein
VTVSFVQIYLDGKAVFTVSGGSLNTSIAASTGTHKLTVQAKDSAGTIFKQTISINVGAAPSPTPTPTPSPTPDVCSPGSASPSVNICSPLNGAAVSSPVHVQAATQDSVTVSFIQIYVDGKAVFTTTGGSLDTLVAMTGGAHRLTVQAKDNAGVIFKQTINITVK